MAPSPTPLRDTNLFRPIKVGPIELQNRLAHAPTSRYRNTDGFVPTDSMLQYYKERAEDNGGLLVFEAAYPDKNFGFKPNGPEIDTDEQVEAWRKIISAVHDAGSFASLQIWGLGRAADPKCNADNGTPLQGPSAIYENDERKAAAEAAHNPLRALTREEIKARVRGFAQAAKRAVERAGVDIVELHSAHMYLMDQFIQVASNHRTDEYGGSIENRARFTLEVVDAVSEAIGAERTAIRLSPYSVYGGAQGAYAETNPIVNWGYILSELERRACQGHRLAYVSVVEPRVSGNVDNPDWVAESTLWVSQIWKGVVMRAGALLHDPEFKDLVRYVDGDDRTLIAASRYYTSNPDLAHRLKNGLTLTPYERSTFYTKGNYGYITWAKYGESAAAKDSELATREPQAL